MGVVGFRDLYDKGIVFEEKNGGRREIVGL